MKRIPFRISAILILFLIFNPVSVLYLGGKIYEYSLQYTSSESDRIQLYEELYGELKNFSFSGFFYDQEDERILIGNWKALRQKEYKSPEIKVLETKLNGKLIQKYIKDAMTTNNGVIFVAQKGMDGDYKAFYCSDMPDIVFLNSLNAKRITNEIYYIYIPCEYVSKFR